MRLNEDSFTVPGLPAFVEAASAAASGHLERLSLECSSTLASAQAGMLLAGCSRPLCVAVKGSHAPDRFPEQLVGLSVEFEGTGSPDAASWDAQMPEVLLHRLARQKLLRSLQLNFQVPNVRLACPFQLPAMEVELQFCLSWETLLDLSWMQRQPCSRLSLRIIVDTDSPSQHALVTGQLLLAPLHCLELCWLAAAPVQLQLMWHRVCPSLHLSLSISRCTTAWQALPRSPSTHIKGCGSWHDLVLDWAALTGHAGSFSLCLHGDERLCILGSLSGGCSIPPQLEGAWQLQVVSQAQSAEHSSKVQGLQGLQVRGGVRYLQNAAAIAAGWTV